MTVWLTRYRGYILILLVNAIILGAVVVFLTRPAPKTIAISPATLEPEPTPTPARIAVYVSGAVQSPGVYNLPDGSRLDEAIKAAGGPTSDADLARVNLAKRLHDEEQVYVPRVGEASPPVAPAGTTGGSTGGKININTATAAELEALPGIGQVLAQRIVEYRQAHGRFTRIEDLMKVSGIGDKLFERIKDLVTV